jgi:hypothetical protein
VAAAYTIVPRSQEEKAVILPLQEVILHVVLVVAQPLPEVRAREAAVKPRLMAAQRGKAVLAAQPPDHVIQVHIKPVAVVVILVVAVPVSLQAAAV